MPRPVKTILFAGTLAGTLDIAAALLRYYVSTGKDPLVVLRYIASGVFGKDAFTGGLIMVLYGLIFHFIIAFSWTILYFVAYPRIKTLSSNRYISGTGYGLIVWCGMNLVVLPLSNVSPSPFNFMKAAEGIAINMVCVGLPVSIIVRKHYTTTK